MQKRAILPTIQISDAKTALASANKYEDDLLDLIRLYVNKNKSKEADVKWKIVRRDNI